MASATAPSAALAGANAHGGGRSGVAPQVGSPQAEHVPPPPFEGGEPLCSAAWREDGLTRVKELRGLADWMVRTYYQDYSAAEPLRNSIEGHLQAAQDAAEGVSGLSLPKRMSAALRGSGVERTLGNVDAAETDLLRLAPLDYVRGQMPSLLAQVQRFLPANDPRRVRMTEISKRACDHKAAFDEPDRNTVVAAYHAANSQRRRDLIRVRSFRDVIFATAFLLAAVAGGLAVLGATHRNAMPLCFSPNGTEVCLSGHKPSTVDIWMVEAVGLVAAALAAAFALRNVRGTSTPYSLPVALAILKLPAGALTAVLGLLLMRGQIVPGLGGLDTPAQILAWAVVFGYGQQLFTGLVDRQAKSVLQDVGGRGAAGDRATSTDA